LAEGSAGSWKHDGSSYQAYYRDMNIPERLPGQALYFSYLFQVDKIGRLSANGSTAGVVMLAASGLAIPKNAAVCAVSLRRDATVENGYNLGVSRGYRGLGKKGTPVVGLDVPGETGGRVFREGETLLIVFEYSYGSATSAPIRFWVNPDPAMLGGATPPPPTMILEKSGSDAGNPVRGIYVNSLGNTSTLVGVAWRLDALRLGNTWAEVTPSAGPVSFAGMAHGAGTRQWLTAKSAKDAMYRVLGY